jgi:3-(methylthio)propanoyl-CoA dehydrogenase
MSDNFYTDNPDLRFHIENTVDWGALIEVLERGSKPEDTVGTLAEAREMYDGILKEFGKFSAREVAPHAREIDEQGNTLVDGVVVEGERFKSIFKKVTALGVYGLPVPRELGGLNAPAILYLACAEIMARAEVSCMTHFGFHTGVMVTLLMHALRDERTVFENGRIISTPYDYIIAEVLQGKAWGCMVLTEPGAGSDLAAIRTTAVHDGSDDARAYILNGEKIFITSGHGQYQLVLARTESKERAPGLEGLSLFLCHQREERDGVMVDNVRIGKVEHKIGHNGSPTTSLIYEDSTGQLIGSLGEGFQLMLVLMNFARLAVGFEGLGVMEAAWRLAREYAAERVTMGKTIDRHEMVADFLEEMELSVVGVRALLFRASQLTELSQRWEQVLKHDPPKSDSERAELESKVKRLKRQARNLTPLCKYAGSEQGVRLARLSMQILGGAGYTKEHLAEKLLRDALVLPIYEGTSQIQSLMAFKDQMMMGLADPQRFITKVARARINAITEKDPLQRGLSKLYTYKYSALQTILMRIARNKLKKAYDMPIGQWTDALFSEWDAKLDFAPGLLHAERLTRILIDVEIGRTLVGHADKGADRARHASRWIARADLRCRALLMEIEEHGDVLLGELAERAERARGAAAA